MVETLVRSRGEAVPPNVGMATIFKDPDHIIRLSDGRLLGYFETPDNKQVVMTDFQDIHQPETQLSTVNLNVGEKLALIAINARMN